MNVQELNFVERVVIALNPDGTFRGAHQEPREALVRDGLTISSRSWVEPLAADALAKVLPKTAAALAHAAEVAREMDQVRTALDAAEVRAVNAEEEAARLRDQVAMQAQAMAAAQEAHRQAETIARSQAAEAAGRILALMAEVEELKKAGCANGG